MDISRLSYKELVSLREEIDASLEMKRREEQAAARAAIADQAKKLGFSLADLFGGKVRGGKRGPVEIKFRNPSNPSETWSGRGRTPNWMARAIKKGGDKDQFRV
jgi:DNA-binding protein H-NS